MAKKKKENDQIEDLQEPEGIEISENPTESMEKSMTETTEKKENLEETETTMAMVHCKVCKKEVDPYSTEKGWKCPGCNKFVQSPEIKVGGETIREVKASKDRPYEITSARNIKFSGSELAQAEMLIQSGVAKDFHDLAKKAFNLIFIKEKLNKAFNVGDNTMELNKEPDPQKTMKQIQEQKLMEAYIKNMDSGNKMDPMSMMMIMRQMENLDKGKSSDGNGFMDKMLEIQLMKSVMGGQDSQTSAVQKELAELKSQMQLQQMMNQQTQMQQGSNSSQNFMQQMEKIRAERDKSIKAAEISAQQERDKNLQLAFDNRKIALESRLQAMEKEMKEKSGGQFATQRIVQMKDEIKAIKEMSKELGDKEKSTGEVFGETMGNIAEKAMPVLQTLLEQKKAQQTQIPQQAMPEQFPPEVIEQAPPNLEPSSDMTETEQQMSNQMSDMYGTNKR